MVKRARSPRFYAGFQRFVKGFQVVLVAQPQATSPSVFWSSRYSARLFSAKRTAALNSFLGPRNVVAMAMSSFHYGRPFIPSLIKGAQPGAALNSYRSVPLWLATLSVALRYQAV